MILAGKHCVVVEEPRTEAEKGKLIFNPDQLLETPSTEISCFSYRQRLLLFSLLISQI